MTAEPRVPTSLAKMRRESTMRRAMKDMDDLNAQNNNNNNNHNGRKSKLSQLGLATESALSPELAAMLTPRRPPPSKLGASLVAAMTAHHTSDGNPLVSPETSQSSALVLPLSSSSSLTGVAEESDDQQQHVKASSSPPAAAPPTGRPSLAATGRMASVRKAMSFRNLGSSLGGGTNKKVGEPLGGPLMEKKTAADPLGGSLHSATKPKKPKPGKPPRANTTDAGTMANSKLELGKLVDDMVASGLQIKDPLAKPTPQSRGLQQGTQDTSTGGMKPRSNLDYLVTPMRTGPKRAISLNSHAFQQMPSKFLDVDDDHDNNNNNNNNKASSSSPVVTPTITKAPHDERRRAVRAAPVKLPSRRSSMDAPPTKRNNLDHFCTPRRTAPKASIGRAAPPQLKSLEEDKEDSADVDQVQPPHDERRRAVRPAPAIAKLPSRRSSMDAPTKRNLDHFCTPRRTAPKASIGRAAPNMKSLEEDKDDSADFDQVQPPHDERRRAVRPAPAIAKLPSRRSSMDAPTKRNLDHFCTPRRTAPKASIGRAAPNMKSLEEDKDDSADFDNLSIDDEDDNGQDQQSKPGRRRVSVTARKQGLPRRAKSGNVLLGILDDDEDGKSPISGTPKRRGPPRRAISGHLDHLATPRRPPRQSSAEMPLAEGKAPASIARPGSKKAMGALPRRANSVDMDALCTPRRTTKKPSARRTSITEDDLNQFADKKKAPPKAPKREEEEEEEGPLPPIAFIKFDTVDDDDVSVIANPKLPKKRPPRSNSSQKDVNAIPEGDEEADTSRRTRQSRQASIACDGHDGCSESVAPSAVAPCWTCTCGHDANLLKFCGMCGGAKTWDCVDCQFANQCVFKFCGMCGSAKPGVCGEESTVAETMSSTVDHAESTEDDDNNGDKGTKEKTKKKPRAKRLSSKSNIIGDKTGSPTASKKVVKKSSKGSTSASKSSSKASSKSRPRPTADTEKQRQ